MGAETKQREPATDEGMTMKPGRVDESLTSSSCSTREAERVNRGMKRWQVYVWRAAE